MEQQLDRNFSSPLQLFGCSLGILLHPRTPGYEYYNCAHFTDEKLSLRLSNLPKVTIVEPELKPRLTNSQDLIPIHPQDILYYCWEFATLAGMIRLLLGSIQVYEF